RDELSIKFFEKTIEALNELIYPEKKTTPCKITGKKKQKLTTLLKEKGVSKKTIEKWYQVLFVLFQN
ncbi:MAG: hypothetical protein ABIM64_05590, partial [candidate division WOR-3 bacterium]